MVQNRQLSLSGSDQVRAGPGSRVRWLSWPALVGDLVGSAHLRKAFGHLNPGPILLSDLALAGLDSPLPAQPDWCPGSRVSGVVKVMTCSFTSPAGRSWQRAMSMCRKDHTRRVREPDPTGIRYRCSWPRGRQQAGQVPLCKRALIVRLGVLGEGLRGGVPGGEDQELNLYTY